MTRSLLGVGESQNKREAQLPGLCPHLLGRIAIQGTPAVGVRVGTQAQIPVNHEVVRGT